MKAITISKFGGSDTLQMSDVPIPKPKENEVLIHINCTAVNPVDWKIREGYLEKRVPHKFPLIPGWDASGTIKSVGKQVTEFQEGDEVYADCKKDVIQDGTYAEYITVDQKNVALKPKNLSFAQAAALPLVALTAWQALFDHGKLKKGQIVFINAGSGGVGSLAVQFAKNGGAKVIASTSQANLDYVKKLGASLVIDYKKDNFLDQIKKEYPQGIDLVFDLLGGAHLTDAAKILKKGGTVVSIVEPFPEEDAKNLGINAEYCFVKPSGEQLKEITKQIEQGKIKLPQIKEMKLSDAAKAQEESREGHVRGKIVLKVS